MLTMHLAERLIAIAYSQAYSQALHRLGKEPMTPRPTVRKLSTAQYLTDGQNCVWPCSYKYVLLSAYLGDYISSPSIQFKHVSIDSTPNSLAHIPAPISLNQSRCKSQPSSSSPPSSPLPPPVPSASTLIRPLHPASTPQTAPTPPLQHAAIPP